MSGLREFSEVELQDYVDNVPSQMQYDADITATYRYYLSVGFRPVFKDRCVDGGYPIMCLRKQLPYIMIRLDNRKVFSAPVEVNDVVKVVDIHEPVYQDEEWVRNYLVQTYDERVADLKVILHPLPRDVVLAIPGDGAGSGYAAAASLGFTAVCAVDSSDAMIRAAGVKGNMVTHGTFDELLQADLDRGGNDWVWIVSHLIDAVPDVIERLVKHGRKMIVYEQYATYRGYASLRKTRLTSGYQVATNIPDYDPIGLISLSTREKKTPGIIPLNVLAEYENITVYGQNNLYVMTSLCWLDPNRIKNYYYVGKDQKDISAGFRIGGRERNGKMLHISDTFSPAVINGMHVGDSAYNLVIGRVMGRTEFGRIFPLISPCFPDELYSMGFNGYSEYSEIERVDELVYSVKPTSNVVEIGEPFLIRGRLLECASKAGGLILSGATVKEYGDFHIVTPSVKCTLTVSCVTPHAETGCEGRHNHVLSVMERHNPYVGHHRSRLGDGILAILPSFFRKDRLVHVIRACMLVSSEVARKACERYIVQGVLELKSGYVFNKYSKSLPDVVSILDFENNFGEEWEIRFKLMFSGFCFIGKPTAPNRGGRTFSDSGAVKVDLGDLRGVKSGSDLMLLQYIYNGSVVTLYHASGIPTVAAYLYGRALPRSDEFAAEARKTKK